MIFYFEIKKMIINQFRYFSARSVESCLKLTGKFKTEFDKECLKNEVV